MREAIRSFRSHVTSPLREKTPSPPPNQQCASVSSPLPGRVGSPGRFRGRRFGSPKGKDVEGDRNVLRSDEFLCGYLDKGSSSPLAKISDRWHKRWFYLDGASARLCYVGEEPSNNMSCLVCLSLSG